MRTLLVTAAIAAFLVAGPAAGQEALGEPAWDGPTATADLMSPEGRTIGQVRLVQTPNRGVLLRVHVRGLEPGEHALHIHETGRCEAPDFSSAGGHYAPRGRAHGLLHPHGAHAGDLANLHVPDSGEVRSQRVAQHVTLHDGVHGTLFDDDGSAVVIHAGADDYMSQPSGAAGSRVACGVIRR